MDTKIFVLAEDNGFASLLDHVLETLYPSSDFFEVVPCGGWTKVFSKYEQLIKGGSDSSDILPVIDADTIEENKPRDGESVLDCPNLFRFEKDLEFAFDNWIIAEALIELSASPFDSERTPHNFIRCMALVNEARQVCIHSQASLHKEIEKLCKRQYSIDEKDPSTFVLPSKMKFAETLTAIVINSGFLPREIKALLTQFEILAAKKGVSKVSFNSISYPTLNGDGIKHAGLTGKLLFSVYPFLWILDFDRQSVYASNAMNFKINYSIWSRDGSKITAEARDDLRRGILVITEDGKSHRWISRKISTSVEGVPCWFPEGKEILLRAGNKTWRASGDSKDWKELFVYGTAYHCVSQSGIIAQTKYENGIYILQLIDKRGNAYIIPGTTDVRGSVSWSPDGKYLAFANQISDSMGDVCLYDTQQKKTRYLTHHDGWPYFVCFSPDNRFVIYTSRSGSERSLRVIEIATGEITLISHPVPDLTIGCHGWKA